MDYLQYLAIQDTAYENIGKVLNLIINGLPSILFGINIGNRVGLPSFKPYYKWITFNTLTKGIDGIFMIERSLFYMVAKFEHFSVF